MLWVTRQHTYDVSVAGDWSGLIKTPEPLIAPDASAMRPEDWKLSGSKLFETKWMLSPKIAKGVFFANVPALGTVTECVLVFVLPWSHNALGEMKEVLLSPNLFAL